VVAPDLFVDDVKVAGLINGGYVVVTVKPGSHNVRLGLPGWQGEAASTGYISAGDSAYFRPDTTYTVVGINGTRTFSLRRVLINDALREIADTKKLAEVDQR